MKKKVSLRKKIKHRVPQHLQLILGSSKNATKNCSGENLSLKMAKLTISLTSL